MSIEESTISLSVYAPREDKGIIMSFSKFSSIEDTLKHICVKIATLKEKDPNSLRLYWHRERDEENESENGLWLIKESFLNSYEFAEDDVVEVWDHQIKHMFIRIFIEEINSVKCFKVTDTTMVWSIVNSIITGIPECNKMSLTTHALYLKTPEKETLFEDDKPMLTYSITPQSDIIFKKKMTENRDSGNSQKIVLNVTRDVYPKSFEKFPLSSDTSIATFIISLRKHFNVSSWEFGLWLTHPKLAEKSNENEDIEQLEEEEGEWMVKKKLCSKKK